MQNNMYTYLCFILCFEFNVFQMQTEFCQHSLYFIKCWADLVGNSFLCQLHSIGTGDPCQNKVTTNPMWVSLGSN